MLLNSLLQLSKASQIPTPPNELDDIISVHVLRRLLAAIHFRDVKVLKHSRRVGILSVGIGSRLGWEDMQLRLIEIAALLHDIGKLGVPDHILYKPGRLSPDETEFIASYNRVALEVLHSCHIHHEITSTISRAHGLDDDSQGCRKKESTLGSRILAVADAFDSLTTDQSYRPAYDTDRALRILEEQTGKGFDRNVVAALERWLCSDRAGLLDDEDAEQASINANAPHDDASRLNAFRLCQAFQYLHSFESLYDAFYLIDEEQRVIMWSAGAARMFGFSTEDLVGQTWHRSIVSTAKAKPDPVDFCLETGQAQCHQLNLRDFEGQTQSFDVQTLPVYDDTGKVQAAMELICDGNQSKKHRGQFRKLQMAATRDALTGVLNRGELEQRLGLAFDSWTVDPDVPYCVMFVDLDHFKAINDRLSHAVGDRVLIDVARLIQDELYSGEQVGRYGGEEFVVLCPETPLEVAIERSERLRRAIMGAEIAGREDLRVTASFGVAQIEEGDNSDSVVKRADEALYDAKNSGRNRTCHRVTKNWNVAKQAVAAPKRSEWVHKAEITACVAKGMLPIKLTGYVQDKGAKLVNVSEDELIVKVGQGGLFGGWGKKGDKQPVKIRIEIQDIPENEQVSRTRRIRLVTATEPIGRPKTLEEFERRACHAIEDLRSYLIAD